MAVVTSGKTRWEQGAKRELFTLLPTFIGHAKHETDFPKYSSPDT